MLYNEQYDDELKTLFASTSRNAFGRVLHSKKYEWEMLRFCNKLGYHIPGAAGKLLKHFERAYNPKSLVSYADRRWTYKALNVYLQLGFSLHHASRPNYWYWDYKHNDLTLLSRVKFQKHKLKNVLKNYDSSLSEAKNMEANGFFKIYDCGNLVYVKQYI